MRLWHELYAGRAEFLSSSSRGPDKSPAQQLLRFGEHQVLRKMPDRRVENPSLSKALDPHRWHVARVVLMGPLCNRKGRGRQDRHPWIDVHIVLLTGQLKVRQPLHQWMARTAAKADRIGDFGIARMSHELATDHELPLASHPKCIAHATMTSRQTHAMVSNCRHHPRELLRSERIHRPMRQDQILRLQEIEIGEGVQAFAPGDLKIFASQNARIVVRHALRLVAGPSSKNDHRTSFHRGNRTKGPNWDARLRPRRLVNQFLAEQRNFLA